MKSLPQPAKHVYESGATGFHLCRKLRAMGVGCAIGAHTGRGIMGAICFDANDGKYAKYQ